MTKKVQFDSSFLGSKESGRFFTSIHIAPSWGGSSVLTVHPAGKGYKILFTEAGVKCLTKSPEIYGFLTRSFIRT